MVLEESNGRTKIHFLGGLGDACLIRKYPVILGPLANIFQIASIGDIYGYEEFREQSRIADLLNIIKKVRLKGDLDKKVESDIITGLSNNSIRYFNMDASKPALSPEYLMYIGKGDIVDVSVPNRFHIILAKQVLEKTQAHLVVEKPLSSSLDEVLEFKDYLTKYGFGEKK